MNVFLGLVFQVSTIKIHLQDYSNTNPMFKIDCFSLQVSKNCFLHLIWCLHFTINQVPGDPIPVDRLVKIMPLLDTFNNTNHSVHYPGKELLVDKSMVLWKRWLVFRQYIKHLRHKNGIKLTEPNGMILQALVYTGQPDNQGGEVHAANVKKS
jgi:hypothetical protein